MSKIRLYKRKDSTEYVLQYFGETKKATDGSFMSGWIDVPKVTQEAEEMIQNLSANIEMAMMELNNGHRGDL